MSEPEGVCMVNSIVRLGIFAFSCTVAIRAQDLGGDRKSIERLLEKIEALERRVSELEAERRGKVGEIAQQSAPQPVEPEERPQAASTPMMNIRGFADIGYAGERSGQWQNSFGLGQVDLIITSRLSERLGILVEAIFEHDAKNATAVDLERVLLQYRHNQYLNVDAGRFHTGIGYYNTAFHHGSWFQTAAGRPLLFRFEDEGGMLPIHNVGVSITGKIPSGKLGLHYLAEIGNGRDYPSEEQVQNRFDGNNGKSVNFGLWAKPEMLSGWRFGGSAYHDRLQTAGAPKLRQEIYAGYAVYERGRWELMNEALLMRHRNAAGTTSVPGFYSQASYRIRSWRPYARYEWMNLPGRDPVVKLTGANPGLTQQVTGGIRYELAEFAALKFQAGRQFHAQHGISLFTGVQLAFTF